MREWLVLITEPTIAVIDMLALVIVMHLTYRHLHYNTDANRVIDDLSLSGPTLGATFYF